MKISVTFRNGEGENWQKVYAEERIQKLKKYLDAPCRSSYYCFHGKIQKYYGNSFKFQRLEYKRERRSQRNASCA